jgi:hypothetical protein
LLKFVDPNGHETDANEQVIFDDDFTALSLASSFLSEFRDVSFDLLEQLKQRPKRFTIQGVFDIHPCAVAKAKDLNDSNIREKYVNHYRLTNC